MSIMKPLLSFRETTEFLDCSKTFLRGLIDDGVIKPRYSKTRIYFLPDEIFNYVKSCPTTKPQKK